jgi:hypothetical protein
MHYSHPESILRIVTFRNMTAVAPAPEPGLSYASFSPDMTAQFQLPQGDRRHVI